MYKKILFITNLIINIIYTNSDNQIDIKKKSVLIFKPNKNEFRVNNIKYREGINPIFALNFRPGIYNVSENPLQINNGWAKYGNNYFKDILIKNDWKTIDKINIYLHKNANINIIASAYYPHFYNNSKLNRIEYKIYHNNNQLYWSKYHTFDYIGKYKFNMGEHLFTFMAKTNDIACLCPTIGTGFNSGHHFAVWKNIIEEEKVRLPVSITLPIYHKVNNDVKINNIERYNILETIKSH